ncbi:hypothetical protein PIB30_108517 [Stylosanthes scabra]|uniref:Uncharacterized protein n=1 Tax=Stylosanthes scabra TaxID=79078 RepID=A0ABU6VZP8_9FABA|nr:hypothetical protein [Stylosanthes scabra]
MSWENEDDSSTDSNDDEVANICLMANDEESHAMRSPTFQGAAKLTHMREHH